MKHLAICATALLAAMGALALPFTHSQPRRNDRYSALRGLLY
jgi:hypothetical protein